jgi:hypothetical protein
LKGHPFFQEACVTPAGQPLRFLLQPEKISSPLPQGALTVTVRQAMRSRCSHPKKTQTPLKAGIRADLPFSED